MIVSAIQGGGHNRRSITNLNGFIELVCHFCEYGRVVSFGEGGGEVATKQLQLRTRPK